MPSFRTHFLVKNVRTDVVITPLEDNCYAIELESTDAFDEDRDPKKQTVSGMKQPDLIVQKTSAQRWVIIQPGSFDLSGDDLKALGKAIENASSRTR